MIKIIQIFFLQLLCLCSLISQEKNIDNEIVVIITQGSASNNTSIEKLLNPYKERFSNFLHRFDFKVVRNEIESDSIFLNSENSIRFSYAWVKTIDRKGCQSANKNDCISWALIEKAEIKKNNVPKGKYAIGTYGIVLPQLMHNYDSDHIAKYKANQLIRIKNNFLPNSNEELNSYFKKLKNEFGSDNICIEDYYNLCPECCNKPNCAEVIFSSGKSEIVADIINCATGKIIRIDTIKMVMK